MIPVYLCEDEKIQLQFLKEIIEKYIFINALDMHIVCCATTPQQLLSRMSGKPENAAYFLDIDLKNPIDGLQLATQIRQQDPRAYIIFTTTHEEMAVTTFRYKVEPLGYLIKNDPAYITQVRGCLQNILEKAGIPFGSPSDKIAFHIGDQTVFLPVDDILFITGNSSHKLTIHTPCTLYHSAGTLRKTMDRLDDRFYLCHRSCLVNTGHIRQLGPTSLELMLDNGSVCPCSLRAAATTF